MYFAKYLPVEGEIKEGDKFLLKADHPAGRLRTCHYIYEGKLYIDAKEDIGWGFVYPHEAQLAKLFLCSRDIQVGDEITFTNGKKDTVIEFPYNDPQTDEDGGYDILLREEGTQWQILLYKVIGEISPNAVWVKEGDTFSADQVHRLPAVGRYKEEWRIKCDNCKTFH